MGAEHHPVRTCAGQGGRSRYQKPVDAQKYVRTYLTMKTTGEHYEATKDLDIAAVAKRIRKDLRRALPGWTFSVRISRYSMGQSIDVKLQRLRDDVSAAAVVDFEAPGCLDRVLAPRGPLKEALDEALAIVDSYNRRDVDLMTDYWNVRFHRSVGMSQDLRDELREAQHEARELSRALGA